jgi:hypothetical protein
MNQFHPSSTPQNIDHQLEQLYLRRVAVDSLIRILEDYRPAFRQPHLVQLKDPLSAGSVCSNRGTLAIA